MDKGPTSLATLLRLLPEHHGLHLLAHANHGKGEPDSATLFLENKDGSVALVRDRKLVEGLLGNRLPRLIFLGSCVSAGAATGEVSPFVGLGPRLVRAGVSAVVAMQDYVGMDTVKEMTGDFYRELNTHGMVDQALCEGRRLLRMQDYNDWDVPVLFMRLRTGQLFDPQAEGRQEAGEPAQAFAHDGISIGTINAENVAIGDMTINKRESRADAPEQKAPGEWPIRLQPHSELTANALLPNEEERTVQVRLAYDLHVIEACTLLNLSVDIPKSGVWGLPNRKRITCNGRALDIRTNGRLVEDLFLKPGQNRFQHTELWQYIEGGAPVPGATVQLSLEVAQAGRVGSRNLMHDFRQDDRGYLIPAVTSALPSEPAPPKQEKEIPDQSAKYNITIQNAKGLVIGDGAAVTQHFGDEEDEDDGVGR
ncbi:MAG: CHAT domain-containing protein [Chloroflexi bacterium]|nr:CHAT domain-containing protein [Chloroflexota bacterium]